MRTQDEFAVFKATLSLSTLLPRIPRKEAVRDFHYLAWTLGFFSSIQSAKWTSVAKAFILQRPFFRFQFGKDMGL